MDFYNAYLRKCLEKGVSPSKAAVEAGTTKTAVSRWKSGSIPSDATLLKLADYFCCTIEELKGITAENPATSEGDGDERNAKREEINRLLDAAPEWLQDQIHSLLKAEESGRTSQGGDPKAR